VDVESPKLVASPAVDAEVSDDKDEDHDYNVQTLVKAQKLRGKKLKGKYKVHITVVRMSLTGYEHRNLQKRLNLWSFRWTFKTTGSYRCFRAMTGLG
jgi:hypothetical protein